MANSEKLTTVAEKLQNYVSGEHDDGRRAIMTSLVVQLEMIAQDVDANEKAANSVPLTVVIWQDLVYMLSLAVTLAGYLIWARLTPSTQLEKLPKYSVALLNKTIAESDVKFVTIRASKSFPWTQRVNKLRRDISTINEEINNEQ